MGNLKNIFLARSGTCQTFKMIKIWPSKQYVKSGISARFSKKFANFSLHILSLILALLYLCSLAREQHCESVTRCFTFQVKLWALTQRHWAIWQDFYPFLWILHFLLQYLHLDQLHSMKDKEISQKNSWEQLSFYQISNLINFESDTFKTKLRLR